MARVKICPICGSQNPETAMVCWRDGCDLADVFAEEPPPEQQEEDQGGPRPPAPRLMLEFPWGPEPIAGEMLLGRDNASFGGRIEAAVNGRYVSGEHAVISCRDDRFFILHVGRTDRNWTYLDDRRIEGEEELRDGHKLSLSKHFHVTVRIR